jgi:CspA family cold shock protein
MTGVVAWFRGTFGFIERDDGGEDLFVHFRGISGPEHQHKVLNKGDRVEFEIGLDPETRKPVAQNVRVLEAANGSRSSQHRSVE